MVVVSLSESGRKDTAMPHLRPRPRRHCTYCPQPGPDCCVRVHPESGQHIYSHRSCAAARKAKPLYVFIEAGR